jgi:hypothetical protein
MIYIYSADEVSGRKIGTGAITNEEETQANDLDELTKLESGIWYVSVNGLQSSHGSRSFVRMIAYIRENFRSKVQYIGSGNTFTHLLITLM